MSSARGLAVADLKFLQACATPQSDALLTEITLAISLRWYGIWWYLNKLTCEKQIRSILFSKEHREYGIQLNSINFNYIIYTYGIGGKSEPRPVKVWNHSCCTGTWLHGAVSVYLPLTCYLSICLISIFPSFYFSSCLSFLLSCFTYLFIYTHIYKLRQTYVTSLGILLLSDDIHETSCFDCWNLQNWNHERASISFTLN